MVDSINNNSMETLQTEYKQAKSRAISKSLKATALVVGGLACAILAISFLVASIVLVPFTFGFSGFLAIPATVFSFGAVAPLAFGGWYIWQAVEAAKTASAKQKALKQSNV